MYIPKIFNEDRKEVLHGLIRSNPLGLLISNGEDGPDATSIPFHLVGDVGENGLLQAHLARANPHWKKLDGQNVLVVFQGPDAYISPNWYPKKEEHGKVVPTWNYAMVQARGVAKVIDDTAWLWKQITKLTNQQEAQSEKPWKVSDAPKEYIDQEIKAIVGLEIAISKIEGKWKVSQNQQIPERQGVAAGLAEKGDKAMTDLVRAYGKLDD
jgi:transcriptional regulator